MRYYGALLLSVFGFACATTTEPSLGDEFQLQVGEHTKLSDHGLWMAFAGVDADSRCPLRVMCIWAGDASVLVETAPLPDAAGDSRTDTLHTHLDPKSLQFGAFELALVRLDPYPEAPSSISPHAYMATFQIREIPQ